MCLSEAHLRSTQAIAARVAGPAPFARRPTLRSVAGDGEELPLTRNALELVDTALGELDAGADD